MGTNTNMHTRSAQRHVSKGRAGEGDRAKETKRNESLKKKKKQNQESKQYDTGKDGHRQIEAVHAHVFRWRGRARKNERNKKKRNETKRNETKRNENCQVAEPSCIDTVWYG